jgi:hypothetical protein
VGFYQIEQKVPSHAVANCFGTRLSDCGCFTYQYWFQIELQVGIIEVSHGGNIDHPGMGLNAIAAMAPFSHSERFFADPMPRSLTFYFNSTGSCYYSNNFNLTDTLHIR